MYIAHVFVLPALIATLIAGHLALVALRHHTQFRRSDPRASERTIVGVPTYPGQTPRSLGLMFFVAGVLVLLGGLVQINPIWLWGPYHVASATNGAQPDWYLGWLIGALRLVPGFDVVIGELHARPEPVLGRRAVPARRVRDPRPLAVAGAAALRRPRLPQPARPAARQPEPHRRRRGALHLGLLRLRRGRERPALHPARDQLLGQVWTYRVLIWVLPVLVFFLTRRFCRELLAHERIELDHEQAEEVARALAEERERRAAEEPA